MDPFWWLLLLAVAWLVANDYYDFMAKSGW